MGNPASRLSLVTFVAGCLAGMLAAPAQAAPPPACQGPVSQRTVYEGQGRLEALIVGGGGPSNLAFGKGRRGFKAAGLYAVSFGGEIVRIDGSRRATVPAG